MQARKADHLHLDAVANGRLAEAFRLLIELRPHLTEPLFRERLQRQQLAGYRLIGAFDPVLVGLLGMRPVETMARGPHLHVDDLVVTVASRGQGIGSRLLEFAEAEARRLGLTAVFLDSRPEALPFYRKHGYAPHTATLVRKPIMERIRS